MKKLLAMLIVLLSFDGIINAVDRAAPYVDESKLTQEQRNARGLGSVNQI